MTEIVDRTEGTNASKGRDEDVFSVAKSRAVTESYLGNVAVVQALLRAEIADFMQTADNQNANATAVKGREIALQLTKIFLGQDETFAGVPGWNDPGRIDRYLAPKIGSTETDAARVIEQWAVRLLTQVVQVANFAAQEGVLDEQWTGELESIVDENCHLIMGIDSSYDEMVDGDIEIETAPAISQPTPESVKAQQLYDSLKASWKDYP